jgi:Malate:quinone oxidoreductase (Mqo)/Cytochrome bd terminal oxidase subunit II
MIANRNAAEPDVVLVGAGIMSATLGTVLKELEPTLNIVLLETLHDCALESSEGWNNAGTGHAANCELNYTPQRPDGSVDISKALEVNTEFDLSRQLWSFLVTKGAIPDPGAFINACPHMSFVWGPGNVAFLRQRFKEMSAHHCYQGMEYSEDRSKITTWAPLIMDGRDDKEPFAATRMITGSDVDYGALTHLLVKHLSDQPGFDVHYNRKVVGLDREQDGRWRVSVEDTNDGGTATMTAKFVFIGAGGGALPLLQKSKIPEGKGYGGFPLSGIWLRCDVDAINGRYVGGEFGWLSPFALMCGVGLCVGYTLLGACWLVRKGEGELRESAYRLIPYLSIGLLIFLIVVFGYALAENLPVISRWLERPYLFVFPAIGAVAAIVLAVSVRARRDGPPFYMVSLIFAAAFGTLAISFWPYMIPFSITIAEAAAPHSSLAFMFWGAGLFVFPLMLIYTAISYSVFRGKVASSGSGY